MFAEILASVRALVVLTAITSVAYPLAITGLAQVFFRDTANGSLVTTGNQIVGSSLLAQKFTSPRYFWPRPSAADYGTVASGASNQGFTSQKLVDAVNDRRKTFGADAPADMLYASGSGLDPHISPEAAQYQVARVASARNLPPEKITALVEKSVEPPQLGFLGQPRVNVLLLNQALDAAH
jgi:K+-transporting ATPase ATPase C chain